MDKGKNKGQQEEHYAGGISCVAPQNPKPQTKSYEQSSMYKNMDKSTGSYTHYTVKEKATANERHVERGSRREGVRDEYKVSETVKVGHKNGYTEIRTEERVRDVKFDTNNYQGGGKRYLTSAGGGSNGYGAGCNDYSYGRGGGSYGYDSDSDSDSESDSDFDDDYY